MPREIVGLAWGGHLLQLSTDGPGFGGRERSGRGRPGWLCCSVRSHAFLMRLGGFRVAWL